MCNLSFIYLYICNRACAHGCTRTKTGRRKQRSSSIFCYLSRKLSRLCIPISNYFELVLISISARLCARSPKHMRKEGLVLYKMRKARRKNFFHFLFENCPFWGGFRFQSMLSYGRRQERDTEDGGQARWWVRKHLENWMPHTAKCSRGYARWYERVKASNSRGRREIKKRRERKQNDYYHHYQHGARPQAQPYQQTV